MHRRSRIAWLLALVLAGAAAAPAPAIAQAERIAELAQTLASAGSTEKSRLAAVVALGKLGDRHAMKPLVGALSDPSAKVRAVAAAALGRLGHRAALPALKTAATGDPDGAVRTNARDAAVAVAKANQLPPPWPPDPLPVAASAGPSAPAKARPIRPGFGNQPRALAPRPDVYVLVNSSADDSPGKADKPTRKRHADIVRQALVDQCAATPVIATTEAEARRLGLDPRHLDVSVVRMEVSTVGAFVEVEAHLRLAISDETGKMLSFLSGGAKVQVPRNKFDPRFLPNLRRDALENAIRGMFDKLLAHLRDQPKS